MQRASRSRLTEYTLTEFQGEVLFDRIGRALCRGSCLPRKEFFEAWEFSRRINRKLKGGRVVDLACGHGLVAYCMLLLDKTISGAVAVDIRIPKSAGRLTESLTETWPWLKDRVQYLEMPLQEFPLEADDLVVSAHACGEITDIVLERATEVGARVAVLPCCHSRARNDGGGLEGWLDLDVAVDVTRAAKLREKGYTVYTCQIPSDISPKNRVLVGYRGERKR